MKPRLQVSLYQLVAAFHSCDCVKRVDGLVAKFMGKLVHYILYMVKNCVAPPLLIQFQIKLRIFQALIMLKILTFRYCCPFNSRKLIIFR